MDHELAGAYEHELRYLIDYARTDWLGFSTFVCSASVLSRLDGTRRRQQEFTFDLVGDLLDRSIATGDFTSSDEIPFEPWSGGRHDVMQRIRWAIENLGHVPDTGAVC